MATQNQAHTQDANTKAKVFAATPDEKQRELAGKKGDAGADCADDADRKAGARPDATDGQDAANVDGKGAADQGKNAANVDAKRADQGKNTTNVDAKGADQARDAAGNGNGKGINKAKASNEDGKDSGSRSNTGGADSKGGR